MQTKTMMALSLGSETIRDGPREMVSLNFLGAECDPHSPSLQRAGIDPVVNQNKYRACKLAEP